MRSVLMEFNCGGGETYVYIMILQSSGLSELLPGRV